MYLVVNDCICMYMPGGDSDDDVPLFAANGRPPVAADAPAGAAGPAAEAAAEAAAEVDAE